MSNSISETIIPNQKKIFYLNQEEVDYLYPQMPNYIRHGIKIDRGDTIFDVGANIGMFSLFVNDLCAGEVNLYAFEPVPQIFRVLQLNVERFNSDKTKIYNCGLSNQSRDAIDFEYFPKASGFSTMFSNEYEAFRRSISSIMLGKPEELPSSVKNKIYRIPQFLRSFIVNFKLIDSLKSKTVTCQLKTIFQIVREENIQQIDLLKIDVEKSELDVLLGIDRHDWAKVRQIVIEAHDIDNRIEKIKTLLSKHNFNKIVVEQEPLLEKSEYFNIYAMRC